MKQLHNRFHGLVVTISASMVALSACGSSDGAPGTASSGGSVGGAAGSSTSGASSGATESSTNGASSGAAGGAGGAGASGSSGSGGGAGATIVSSQQIHQNWGVGSWEGGTIQVPKVQAGDAIFVLGVYWITPKQGAMPAPSDSNGQLSAAVNQAPAYAMPGNYPPVAAQIYYQLNAAPGTHTITPPDLVDGGGDGTLYVVQVRDLGASAKLVAVGDSHKLGAGIPSVSVALSGPALAGDLVVAVGGYDNSVVFPSSADVSNPPAGWKTIGVQNDSSINVPSEACYRLAASPGNQVVAWTWVDPNANVTAAAIAAFR